MNFVYCLQKCKSYGISAVRKHRLFGYTRSLNRPKSQESMGWTDHAETQFTFDSIRCADGGYFCFSSYGIFARTYTHASGRPVACGLQRQAADAARVLLRQKTEVRCRCQSSRRRSSWTMDSLRRCPCPRHSDQAGRDRYQGPSYLSVL